MATNNEKRTLLTETPSSGFNKKTLHDALTDSKDSRSQALMNAHDALVNAFGPKLVQTLKTDGKALFDESVHEYTTSAITIDDLEKMLLDMDMELNNDEMLKECRQRLDEAKGPDVSPTEKEKMYKDIHRKFWAYVQSLPTKNIADTYKLSDTENAVKKFLTNKASVGIPYISHEGSLIVSALIGVSEGGKAAINVTQLPESDRTIVLDAIREQTKSGIKPVYFWVELDQYKNFEFSFEITSHADTKITIGNRVSSIPPHEAGRFSNDVKIEKKGSDILIGDRIKLEKNKVQAAIQPIQDGNSNKSRNGGGFTPRPKVSGRNAFEIRTDILEMALDFVKYNNKNGASDSDVLDVAEAFYSFVEQK